MLTHVENVLSLIRIDFRSCLISCVFSVIDQTRHQNVVKQYAGLCDTLPYRAHTPRVCSFWSRLKASKGVSWDRPTATGCIPFCFLAQREREKERRNIHSPSSSLHISYALPSLIFNKRERQASDRRQLDVYLFALLSSRFAHVFRQIVIGVGTLSSTNLFALRHRKKTQQLAPLVDVRP